MTKRCYALVSLLWILTGSRLLIAADGILAAPNSNSMPRYTVAPVPTSPAEGSKTSKENPLNRSYASLFVKNVGSKNASAKYRIRRHRERKKR